jgi:hypothetical protein
MSSHLQQLREFKTDILQQLLVSSLSRLVGESIGKPPNGDDSSHHAFHAYPNHNRVKNERHSDF